MWFSLATPSLGQFAYKLTQADPSLILSHVFRDGDATNHILSIHICKNPITHIHTGIPNLFQMSDALKIWTPLLLLLLFSLVIVGEDLPCASNPCQNGGECSDSGNTEGYTCLCQVGITGTNCETGMLIPFSEIESIARWYPFLLCE